jgi:hypothetical protein
VDCKLLQVTFGGSQNSSFQNQALSSEAIILAAAFKDQSDVFLFFYVCRMLTSSFRFYSGPRQQKRKIRCGTQGQMYLATAALNSNNFGSKRNSTLTITVPFTVATQCTLFSANFAMSFEQKKN